jgi:hypothetical protein
MASEFKELGWADFFIYALSNPRALYRKIHRAGPRSFAFSFIFPALVAIGDIIALSLLGRQTTFFYYKVTYGWIFMFLYASLISVVSASLMDLASQFMGRQGNIRELISLVNFSLFPKVFLLPLLYITKVFNFAPIFFYFFFSISLYIWAAMVAIQGISEMHGIGFGRSVFIFLFPLILVSVVGFFMLILFSVSFIGFFAG